MLEFSNMQHFCFCLYSSRMNKFLNNSIDKQHYLRAVYLKSSQFFRHRNLVVNKIFYLHVSI